MGLPPNCLDNLPCDCMWCTLRAGMQREALRRVHVPWHLLWAVNALGEPANVLDLSTSERATLVKLLRSPPAPRPALQRALARVGRQDPAIINIPYQPLITRLFGV